MMPAAMARRLPLLVLLALGALLGLSACGTRGISVAENAPEHHGAELFAARCSGCHTLQAAGTRGSASDVRTRLRTNGPNFTVRKENADRVLYAIRNGGFSGAIMPQNIVVGPDADAVAGFVARYSGLGKRQNSPSQGAPAGAQGSP